MRFVFFIMLLISGCKFSYKQPPLHKGVYEQIAIDYLKDSLICRKEAVENYFARADNNLLITPIISYDSFILNRDGFLHGYRVYVDSLIYPASDSTLYGQDDSRQNEQTNDDSTVDDTLFISLKAPLIPIKYDAFVKQNLDSSVFIEINKAFEFEKQHIVKARIYRYFGSVYEYYDLYFILGKDKVEEWYSD